MVNLLLVFIPLAVQPRCSPVQNSVSWKPLTGLTYKLNVDAAVFTGLTASGVRAVVRNEKKGEVMAALPARGLQVTYSKEAEVLACQKAVEFAMEAGIRDLILEGDNVNVMKSIMVPKANYARLGHIYEDIRGMAMGLRYFSVSFVKRNANSVAHSLAKFARQVDRDIIWLEESPPLALDALYFDNISIMNE